MLIRLLMYMSIKTIIITRQDRSYEPKMVNLWRSRASQNTAWCTYLHCINNRHFFVQYTRNLATSFLVWIASPYMFGRVDSRFTFSIQCGIIEVYILLKDDTTPCDCCQQHVPHSFGYGRYLLFRSLCTGCTNKSIIRDMELKFHENNPPDQMRKP
jgi:hypothetical protein